MTKKNGLTKAPYDSRGNLLHFAGRLPNEWSSAHEWRPNEPMELRLTIDGVTSGRSAKYVTWLDADGHHYPMFVVDLVEMIRDGTPIVAGAVHAMFRVRKRGQNYGLCYDGKVTWTDDDPADSPA